MLLDANLQEATPAEVVALARLAESAEMPPPPHLCPDLETKGWADFSEGGEYVLTSEGRPLLDKFDWIEVTMRLLLTLVVLTMGMGPAVSDEWRRYADPTFGYSVAIPEDGFDVETDPSRNGLTIYERGGRGQIDVYGIHDGAGLSLAQMKAALSKASRIKQITYSRAGASWFVVSGYYKRPENEDAHLIFYAKFMRARDGRSVAAFEASYPVDEKRRFDPIIDRMEDSLTPPD
jgi:hypothetical protein